MVRFTVQLFGVTVFALGLIWFVGSGEAQQSDPKEPVLWADTSTSTWKRRPTRPPSRAAARTATPS